MNNLFVHNGKYRDGVDIQIALASGVAPFIGYSKSLELSVRKSRRKATLSLLNHLCPADVGDLAYIASSSCDFQMLEILLLNSSISDLSKRDCLMIAVHKGRLDIIKLLLTQGKPISDANISINMLFKATGSGNSKLIDKPIKYGYRLLLRAIEYRAHNGIIKDISIIYN